MDTHDLIQSVGILAAIITISGMWFKFWREKQKQHGEIVSWRKDVEHGLDTLRRDFENHKEDPILTGQLNTLCGGMQGIKSDVEYLRDSHSKLRNEIHSLDKRVAVLQSTLNGRKS